MLSCMHYQRLVLIKVSPNKMSQRSIRRDYLIQFSNTSKTLEWKDQQWLDDIKILTPTCNINQIWNLDFIARTQE